MAGTNSRNDPFYVGDLNTDSYVSTPERYWAGGVKAAGSGDISVDHSDVIAALQAQTAELIAELDDDFVVIE